VDAKKYFAILAEIDYLMYLLTKMLEEEKLLTPLHKAIDDASGYGKEKLKRAKSIIRQIERRKKTLQEGGVKK